MGIVALGTVEDYTRRRPTARTLSVRTAFPVGFLRRVTLRADFVGMIEENGRASQRAQLVDVGRRVTGRAAHDARRRMNEINLPVRCGTTVRPVPAHGRERLRVARHARRLR